MLAGAGLVAGVINTLAGGGSLLTVPLLIMLGLPGTIANGTNRIGILVMSIAAVWGFKREGLGALDEARPVLLPVALGGLIGAYAVAQMTDAAFERAFALIMLAFLVPTLRAPKRPASPTQTGGSPGTGVGTWLLFFLIGLYGGAIQAGVGILLVLALSYAGYDLVRANAIKVLLTLLFTVTAVPVFLLEGQIQWIPGLALAVGFSLGGVFGARLAVRGGERVIRPVLAGAVVVLAARLLGVV